MTLNTTCMFNKRSFKDALVKNFLNFDLTGSAPQNNHLLFLILHFNSFDHILKIILEIYCEDILHVNHHGLLNRRKMRDEKFKGLVYSNLRYFLFWKSFE